MNRELARHSAMRKTIVRAVRQDFYVKNKVIVLLFGRLDFKRMKYQKLRDFVRGRKFFFKIRLQPIT